MKKMGKEAQVSASSEMSEDDFPDGSELASGDQAIPVVESEQPIGNGLVAKVPASEDDDFSDDFDASASASLDQRKKKSPLISKPQKLATKPKVVQPIAEGNKDEEDYDDDFAGGEVAEPTEVVVHESNVAQVEKSASDDEIEDEFSDDDAEQPAEVVVKESNIARVEVKQPPAEEEDDDDFADGEVEEPAEVIVEESNVVLAQAPLEESVAFSVHEAE